MYNHSNDPSWLLTNASGAEQLPHGSPNGDPSRRKPGESCAMPNGGQAHIITEVARMYYEKRQTQLEIAKTLNVSQGTVCRFLKRAEKRGIVRTMISPPVGTFVELEELLER